MKRLFLFAALVLPLLSASAQKITCADSLRVFYTRYFTYDGRIECDSLQRLLVSSYSTKEFYEAWNEDVNDIGLYDPLTEGAGATPEELEYMKNTLSVVKEKDYYSVSFRFHGWQGDIIEITVYVYINSDGKISHTKRPKDGYMTPEK